ncbi:hypothetical protein QWZ10_17695 [Paracoccus cavernae]|uniref:Uncharacterized protein n=1 Tax=Paracoccus cavernae TaxID=1571207 RepID=A0ABT8DB64_9RHOB|nr:hypothetical protein [Paracoccus cavernae]
MLINQLRLEQRDDTGFSGSLAISTVYDAPGPAQIEMGFVAPVTGQGGGDQAGHLACLLTIQSKKPRRLGGAFHCWLTVERYPMEVTCALPLMRSRKGGASLAA